MVDELDPRRRRLAEFKGRPFLTLEEVAYVLDVDVAEVEALVDEGELAGFAVEDN